jgi:hypothetical protein
MEHVTYIGDMRNEYKILVGNPEVEIPRGWTWAKIGG